MCQHLERQVSVLCSELTSPSTQYPAFAMTYFDESMLRLKLFHSLVSQFLRIGKSLRGIKVCPDLVPLLESMTIQCFQTCEGFTSEHKLKEGNMLSKMAEGMRMNLFRTKLGLQQLLLRLLANGTPANLVTLLRLREA